MTNARREDIMSQECLSIKDIQELCDMPYPTASEYIRKLKTKLTIGMGRELRIDINGKIHTLDYFDAVGAFNYPTRYYLEQQGEAQ